MNPLIPGNKGAGEPEIIWCRGKAVFQTTEESQAFHIILRRSVLSSDKRWRLYLRNAGNIMTVRERCIFSEMCSCQSARGERRAISWQNLTRLFKMVSSQKQAEEWEQDERCTWSYNSGRAVWSRIGSSLTDFCWVSTSLLNKLWVACIFSSNLYFYYYHY